MHTFAIASLVLTCQASPPAPAPTTPSAPAAPAAPATSPAVAAPPEGAPTTAEAPVAPVVAAAPPAPTPVIDPVERRNAAGLAAAIETLRAKFPTLISTTPLARSVGQLPITMLVLSDNAEQAGTRPAILVVAGMEGPRWSAPEAALVAAEVLARDHADLLKETTVFIVPRANPDAAESFATNPLRDYSGNAAPHDNDRDRRVDEDGPVDLNGDGFITQIRMAGSKPPWTNPTLVADDADPRMMRKPDPAKGQTPLYTVWTEGIDADADGRIAEDWKGGIAIDRNFPHRWPEFEDEAGAYPLIAPESKALADFVIGNPRIYAAVVLGRTDTLVNVPDGKAKAEGGMAAMLDEADVAAYTEVAKAYRELLAQKRAAGNDTAGSLIAWMNAQRGVPTFGAQLWGRPDLPPKAPAEGEPKTGTAAATAKSTDAVGADAAKSSDAPKSPVAADGAPAAPAAGAAAAGAAAGAEATPRPEGGRASRRGPRGGAGGPPPRRAAATGDAPKAMDEEDAAWLAYSDQMRGGSGFVPWTKIPHPQLGEVEVGGWVAGFRDNPPLAEVRPLGEKTGAFIAKLTEFRPQVQLRAPVISTVGPGLYRVDAQLANVGRLPTIERGGRAEGVTPAHVVRISTPVDRIKSGRRIDIVRGLDPGEVRGYDWLIAAQPDEVVAVELLFAGQPMQRFTFRDGMLEAPAADAAPGAAAAAATSASPGASPNAPSGAPPAAAPRTPAPSPRGTTPIPHGAQGGAA